MQAEGEMLTVPRTHGTTAAYCTLQQLFHIDRLMPTRISTLRHESFGEKNCEYDTWSYSRN